MWVICGFNFIFVPVFFHQKYIIIPVFEYFLLFHYSIRPSFYFDSTSLDTIMETCNESNTMMNQQIHWQTPCDQELAYRHIQYDHVLAQKGKNLTQKYNFSNDPKNMFKFPNAFLAQKGQKWHFLAQKGQNLTLKNTFSKNKNNIF